MFERAIGHQQLAHPMLGQMSGRQFDGVASADQQDRGLVEFGKGLLGQTHGGEGHRDRLVADAGFAAGALGHGEGVLEQTIQRGLEGALQARRLPGLLDLTQDLGLAQNHRIQPCRDPEQVTHGGIVFVVVQVRVQVLGLQMGKGRQPEFGPVLGPVFHPAVDLGAVAGRQQGDLVHTRLGSQFLQRHGQSSRRNGQPFAYRERGSLVIQAEGEQGHGLLGLDFDLRVPAPTVDGPEPMQRLLVYLLLALCVPTAVLADGVEQALEPLLQAEFSFQQGDLPAAARAYAAASEVSEDPAVARRAVQMALEAREIELARKGLARWTQLAPEAEDLALIQLRLALLEEQIEPARAALAQLLARPEGWRSAVAAMAMAHGSSLPGVLIQERLEQEQMPAQLDAWLAFGAVAVRLGEQALYARLARAAGDHFPTEPRALIWRAEEALSREDEATARQVIDTVVALPDLGRTERLAAAMHLNALGDPAAAARVLVPLEDDDQAYSARAGYLLAAHDQAGLTALYEQIGAATATTEVSPSRLLLLGQLAEMLEKRPEALTWYRRITKGVQRDQASLRMAVVLDHDGQTEAALDLLRELQASEGQWGDLVRDAYLLEAELARRHGDAQAELTALDRGLDIFEDDPLLRYNRALAHERLDQVDAAVADLRALVESDPDNPDWLNALGYTLVDRTKAFAEGLTLIERALAAKPDSPAIRDSMGWALHRLGRDAEALPHLEYAFEQQREAEVAAHLVSVLVALDQWDEARSILRLARELDPDDRALIRVLHTLPAELTEP